MVTKINHSDTCRIVAELLPRSISVSETNAPFSSAGLLPAEEKCVERAVPVRVREFAAGRTCAHHALAPFGYGDFAVLVRQDRSPLWPPDIVGSITHTSEYCGAAVGRRSDFLGIGIDAEEVGRVDQAIARKICRPAELAWLAQFSDEQWAIFSTLFFSAKEAFFKCQHSLNDTWLDFKDVCLSIEGSNFTARLNNGPPRLPGDAVVGKFRIASGMVFSAIAIPNA